MPEVLERPQSFEDDRVTEMQVGAGGIDPQLHPQRAVATEQLAQRIGLHHLGHAPGEDLLDGGITLHWPMVPGQFAARAPSEPLC